MTDIEEISAAKKWIIANGFNRFMSDIEIPKEQWELLKKESKIKKPQKEEREASK